MGPTSSSPQQQRENLIASHMPMATRVAHGFAGRGQEVDDLVQVAMLELVKAVSRFDPARGVAFAQYVYPCIVGGLKRHFRDNGWSLHISRRLQELHLRISQAVPGLTQLLGRRPTVTDLAGHLNLSEQDARDGLQAGLAYQTRPLTMLANDGQEAELGEILGAPDENLESVPDRHVLGHHISLLPTREQNILHLRFFSGFSQREISEQLGISQMQVSRLLARSIDRLRLRVAADG